MVPTAGYVAEFHETFCVPSSDDNRTNRWKLIREEVLEVKEALESGDRAKIAKELADLVYVAYGAALLYDIRLDEAIREVHRSNMTKLGEDGRPIKDNTGKVLKGPNYTEADMTNALSPGPTIEDKRCPTCEAIQIMLDGDLL